MKLVKAFFYKDTFSFAVIGVVTIFTSISIIFFFDNYNSVAFSDHDEGYLLEQLILKLSQFNIDRVQSIEAAYGVEFYYLKFFFNFLGLFTVLSKLSVFYILIFFHGSLALGSFYIIFKIFDLFKISKIYNIIFLLTILSVPEIFNNSLSLKPDLNLLFFSCSCILYYFIKFNLFNNKKDYYLLILFVSFSLTIKVWSLPFLIIFFFIKFNYKDDLRKFKGVFLLLIITLFFFVNHYFLDLQHFLNTDIELLNFISSNQLFLSIKNYFNTFFYLFLFLINIFLMVLISIIVLSKKKNNFIFSFILFFALWFVLISPFIFDFTTFFKTLYVHTYSTHLNSDLNHVNYESPIVIYFKDLLYLKINPIILILLVFSPLIILKLKKKLLFNNYIIIFFFSLSILLFIFKYSLTSYPNQFPIKYLYFIFATIFIFYLLDKLIIFNKKYLIILYTLIFFNFVCFAKNSDQYKNTMNYISSKYLIQKMLDVHKRKYFDNISNLFICGGPYPANFKKNELNVIFIRASICHDKEFYEKLSKKDLVIINSVNTNLNFLNDYVVLDKENIKKVGRFGKIDIANLFFLKKI